jgi:hypothetical protein
MRRPRREGRDRARRFSPGLAARIACYDGRRWFVKAASGQVNPGTPRLHRQEAGILRGLDPLIRSGQLPAPQLRAAAGHGSWFVLITDDIDGRHPVLPWEDRQAACGTAGSGLPLGRLRQQGIARRRRSQAGHAKA